MLNEIFLPLLNKEFLPHHAKYFDQAQASLANSYNDEEPTFLQNVTSVSRSAVRKSTNIIGSHTIYKV